MATFKYNGTDPLEIAGLLQIRVSNGQTFEVPDEIADQFEAQPELFASSRAKNPDVTPDTLPPVSAETPAPTTTN